MIVQDNFPAVKTYEACGFIVAHECFSMEWSKPVGWAPTRVPTSLQSYVERFVQETILCYLLALAAHEIVVNRSRSHNARQLPRLRSPR
eukprot:COSAG02_NODE_15746_length_1144_cov_1.266029_1_plen_88_part_10